MAGCRSASMVLKGRRVNEPQRILHLVDRDTANLTESDTEDGDSTITGSESASKPYIFHDEERSRSALQGFQTLYDSRLLFDVTLTVDGKEFECHKALLAASSEYFRCLFTTQLAEKNQTNISVSGVDAKSMQLVMDYLYQGKVRNVIIFMAFT